MRGSAKAHAQKVQSISKLLNFIGKLQLNFYTLSLEKVANFVLLNTKPSLFEEQYSFFLDNGSQNKELNYPHKIQISRLEYLSLSKKLLFVLFKNTR